MLAIQLAALGGCLLGTPSYAQNGAPAVPAIQSDSVVLLRQAKPAERTDPLTMSEFVRILSTSDESVQVQRLEEDIAREGVQGAMGVFEPTLAFSVDREQSFVLNTASEILQRSNQATYFSKVDSYKTALAAKAITGADVELSYNVTRIENSLQTLAGSFSPEYRAYLGVKVTQPLLRNAGKDATISPIKVAEYDVSVAKETVRQVLTQRVMEGLVAYFNVQRAQERVKLRSQALELSESLAKEIRTQEKLGLKSQGDALDAESNLALRRSQLAQARQDLSEQLNTFQAMISARSREPGSLLKARLYSAADPLELLAAPVELPEFARQAAVQGLHNSVGEAQAEEQVMPELLTTSLERRPENRVNRIRIEREDVRVGYAENQKLPELNLVGRYAVEDLNKKPEYRGVDAYLGGSSIPYNSWMVGVQFKMGIFGDEKKTSEYSIAKVRRQQAVLAQSAVQQRIVNELVTSVGVLDQTLQQVKRLQEVAKAQKDLLAIDRNLLKEGRKSSIDIMKKRLEILTTEESLADAVVLANRASFIVSQARGLVLSRLNLE